MKVPPVILSIAGYDPSSGAGITADVKTASAQGCFASTCITALTVQSSQGVFQVTPLDPNWVQRTLEALLDDLEISAVKVGMLGSADVASVVASTLKNRGLPNIVVDPVLRSSSGAALLDDLGLDVLRRKFLPLADVITPNLHEAGLLAGVQPPSGSASWDEVASWLRTAGTRLRTFGSRGVVVTGGHLADAIDYLSYIEDGRVKEEFLPGSHIESGQTHGTGCAFATALACQLALGRKLLESVRAAKGYVRKAIEAAYPLGKGTGPINHIV